MCVGLDRPEPKFGSDQGEVSISGGDLFDSGGSLQTEVAPSVLY